MDYSTLLADAAPNAQQQTSWGALTQNQKLAMLLQQNNQLQQQPQMQQQPVNQAGHMSGTQGAAQLVQAVMQGRQIAQQRAQQQKIQQLLAQQQGGQMPPAQAAQQPPAQSAEPPQG